jgi:hypothetical protein
VDFRLDNELAVNKPETNSYFSIENNPGLQNLKNAAIKLGLTEELSNPSNGVTAWTKNDAATTNSIVYYRSRNYVEIRYPTGINAETVKPEDSFNYVTQFLGFTSFPVSINSNSTTGSSQLLTFSQKYNDKNVLYPTTQIGNASTIRIENGKITEANLYYIGSEAKPLGNLNNISKISNENLSSFQYYVTIKPASNTTGSQLGSEPGVYKQLQFAMKSYKESYTYYYDIKNNSSYLVPSLEVTGNYIDRDNNIGTFTLNVINQAP